MEYTFEETGEKIKPERWQWGVVYNNGKELKQFADDGTFHRIGEIDQDNIKLAALYKPDEPSKRIDIVWQEGMKIIHKYRNIKPYYMNKWVRVYIWGYKQGKNYHYSFILPDDRIIMSNKNNISLEKFELQRVCK